MTDPENECGNDDFAVEPPQPPEWLVRAELRDLAHLPPTDPIRIRRIRALYGMPDPQEER